MMVLRFAAVTAVLLTAACSTTLGPPEIVEARDATRYGTRVAHTEGSSQGVPCGLNRTGSAGLAEPGPEEVQVGYDNRRFEGGLGTNDPFACDRWQVNEYVGAIQFDLSDFTEPVIVDSAWLVMTRAPSDIAWRDVETMDGDEQCTLEITAVDDAWTDTYDRGPSATFARQPSTRAATNIVRVADRTNTPMTNVTGIVTNWLTQRRSNSGFRIRQTRSDGTGPSHENNRSCTNIYSGATLGLTIRRFVPVEP
jgi:hypothetical protein